MSLGHLDITTAVMTMSGFRTNPHEGHLEHVRRIVGFLLKFKHAALRYRTECPDFTYEGDSAIFAVSSVTS